VDWATICDLAHRGGKMPELTAWLYAAHQMVACPLPHQIHPRPGTFAHYFRSRLQVRWRWTNALISRASRFSDSAIRERYKCGSGFVSLAAGRVRLASSMAYKFIYHLLRRLRIVI
jgi:hypothetical protein